MKIFKALLIFTVLCAGFLSCTEPVEEKSEVYSISFAENPKMVSSEAGNYSVSFISENTWDVSTEAEWINDLSIDESKVNFSVLANESPNRRDGALCFSSKDGSFTKNLTVRQAAKTNSLSVDKQNVTISTVGESQQVIVSCSENWTVSCSEPWLIAKANNSASLQLSAAVNYTGEPLSADLTISTISGKESLTIKVKQEYDGSHFAFAKNPTTRKFVYKSGLVKSLISEEYAKPHEDIEVLKLRYNSTSSGKSQPYSLFVYNVKIGGNISIAATCAGDDNSSIKPAEAEQTTLQTLTGQLSAMQSKRSEIEVMGGINGDFFYGYEPNKRNNLLHGVMHRGGVCLKSTFDGGSACTVFAIMKDGTAKIMNQAQYAKYSSDIAEAIGGRQMLLSSGDIQSFATTLEPRTAVGVSADGKEVILLVMDGRRSAYSNGASYLTLSQIMLALGAYNAINLDGGGSSTFVEKVNNSFTTTNQPSDNADRAIANGLAVYKKL